MASYVEVDMQLPKGMQSAVLAIVRRLAGRELESELRESGVTSLDAILDQIEAISTCSRGALRASILEEVHLLMGAGYVRKGMNLLPDLWRMDKDIAVDVAVRSACAMGAKVLANPDLRWTERRHKLLFDASEHNPLAEEAKRQLESERDQALSLAMPYAQDNAISTHDSRWATLFVALYEIRLLHPSGVCGNAPMAFLDAADDMVAASPELYSTPPIRLIEQFAGPALCDAIRGSPPPYQTL